MAIELANSATQTTTGGVDSLFTTTVSGVYVTTLDLNALAAGDVLEIAVRPIVLNGGTERDAYRGVYVGAQAQPIIATPPVAANISYSVDIELTAGSNRAIPWSLVRLDA